MRITVYVNGNIQISALYFVFLGNLESFEKIVENELSQQNLEIYKQVVKEYIEELIDMRKKNKQ